MTLDLERFEQTLLNREPFEYLVVPEFVKPQEREAISDDYPKVNKAGSFPLSEVTFGPKFKELTDDLKGSEFRAAVGRKFSIDLIDRPTMITVRGRCSEKDGKIHTDSKTKIITVLLYMNSKWESAGGRLRLLRSENNLDDVVLELPPVAGTLLAFKRSDNSWHGHKPFDRRAACDSAQLGNGRGSRTPRAEAASFLSDDEKNLWTAFASSPMR